MTSTAKHKYRYILAGNVKPSDPISAFRLIGASNLGYANFAIRIIVDDVELIKYSCDCYSTTNDTRTLAELGYDCMIRINWKWTVCNDLRPKTENDVFVLDELIYNNGYLPAMRIYKGRKQSTYLDDVHAQEHYNELHRLSRIKAKKELEECNGDINEMTRRFCEQLEYGIHDTDPLVHVD